MYLRSDELGRGHHLLPGPPEADDQECAARTLGLPEEHRVAMVISFGYPESKESLHRGIPRTSLDELVRYERW